MAFVSQKMAWEHIGKTRGYLQELVKRYPVKKDERGRVDLDDIKQYAEQYEHDKAQGAKKRAAKSANRIITDLENRSLSELSDYLEQLRRQVDDDPVSVQERARALQLIFQAKLADIDARAKEGLMITREAASAAFNKAFLAGVEIIRALPQRAAPLCEGKTVRDIEVVLENEVNAAFEAIQKLHP